ncbi:MAG: T9SS type A sorting domain-containing protein [Bacteroidia bacterium]|nr:T9SS type A sorting domain-containing protein [Bacteroidia bacterium]
MKKTVIIMTAVMALGVITMVFAQKPMRSFDGDQRIEHLKKELNLTDQQEQQVQTLITGFREEMKAMMEDPSISREQKLEKKEGFRENHRAEMRKILTEEQAANLDELMANRPLRLERGDLHRMGKRGNRQGMGERGGRPEMMNKMIQARTTFNTELTLEEKAIITEFREKLDEFRENCPEHKTGERNFHKRGQSSDREQGIRPFEPEEMKPLMEIAKNHKESLKSIFEQIRPEGIDRPERKDCLEGRMHMGPKGDRAKRGAVRFLLLDPSKAETAMMDENAPVFIYPNPANNVINVQIINETSQQVKIELFSKGGKLHEVLFESTVPAGKQTHLFNISHLPSNNIYFIKTTIAQETTVNKLLKN